MSGLMDLISQHIGKDQIGHIAKQIGATPEQTESAVSLAIPTLLGAVARKADSDEGVQQLHQQLQQHDSGGLLGQLTGMLGGSAGQVVTSALGGGGGVGDLLGSILGGRQSKVEQGIGKASGLSAGQIGSLMAMLAPLVMGTLGKYQKSQNMDAGVLGGMLRKEKQSMENQASGGLLSGLLDQDGDGDFDFQDIMKLGMKKLFGR
jgi:hypothetical protein